MANVLMLGNGFDLYHKLLTSYDDFMIIGEHFSKYYSFSCKDNVYLELYDLANKSESIKNSLAIYEEAYKKTKINPDELTELIELIKSNYWFKCILVSKKGHNWFSLENEIDKILVDIENEYWHRIDCFLEFLTAHNSHRNNYVENDRLILEQYEQFLDILKLYLKIFVDNVLPNIQPLDISYNSFLRNNDYIISFNYTNTYKQLYDPILPDKKLIYIHGKLERSIVVGINANEDDIVGSDNQRFINYKKYYQRITKHTFEGLGLLIRVLKNKREKRHLKIIGHSLDIADGDIITVLFDWFEIITIYYYTEEALDKYVKNLKIIFGAKELSKMTFSQKIVFEKLPPNEYVLSLSKNSE